MARNLLLPDGLPRRVVVGDDYDPTTGEWVNPRVVYLDDDESLPKSIAEIEDILAKDAATHDIVAEKAIDSAIDAKEGDDPLEQIKATLDALEADDSAEADAWKAKRTTAEVKK